MTETSRTPSTHRPRSLWVVTLILVLSSLAAAIYLPNDVENVPVERVVTNLERQVGQRPKDVTLRVNLARVHAMAYAQKVDAIPAARARNPKTTGPIDLGAPDVTVPWAGQFVPPFRQFEVKSSQDAKVMAAAREHLTKAIARYREALQLEPANLVAKMGLGWALGQAGDKSGAIAALRDVVTRALPENQQSVGVLGGERSLTEEAVLYLVPLLDPVSDRAEIDRLKAASKELASQPRPITPIAVPLSDELGAGDLVDTDASVAFDLDGSALPQRWNWIRPNAAWLVFDKRGTGSITSGLQLFGSVTFWLFWPHGYDALRALDDNGDRRISGPELTGFALWHDRNSNGRSEPGEARSIADWAIVSLSCEYEFDASHPDEIAFSPRGVTFRDGTTRPTFDLVLRTSVALRRQGINR